MGPSRLQRHNPIIKTQDTQSFSTWMPMSIKCVHQASHNEQQSILLVALDNVNSLLALSDAQSSCKVLLLSLSSCSSLAAKRSCKKPFRARHKQHVQAPLACSKSPCNTYWPRWRRIRGSNVDQGWFGRFRSPFPYQSPGPVPRDQLRTTVLSTHLAACRATVTGEA